MMHGDCMQAATSIAVLCSLTLLVFWSWACLISVFVCLLALNIVLSAKLCFVLMSIKVLLSALVLSVLLVLKKSAAVGVHFLVHATFSACGEAHL